MRSKSENLVHILGSQTWGCYTYTIINNELYKRSVSGAFQRCVSPEEGRKILHEIHSGDCGHHASSRSLVAKAFRHGFFWLTALADAEQIVRVCDGCQRYARQDHMPAQALRTIPITWPFAVWGFDMVGPFKRKNSPPGHGGQIHKVDRSRTCGRLRG
jgi:hypothetical protein